MLLNFDEYNEFSEVFEDGINNEFWTDLFEKEEKASTLKQEVGGSVGGLATGIGATYAAHKMASSRKDIVGKKLASDTIKGDNIQGSLLSRINPFNKNKRKIASKYLKRSFNNKNFFKSLKHIGLSLAISSIVFALGVGLAKSIIGKLESLTSQENDLRHQLQIETDPKRKEAIQKRLDLVIIKKDKLKTETENKVKIEKERKEKLNPEELAKEKEKAKLETIKLVK